MKLGFKCFRCKTRDTCKAYLESITNIQIIEQHELDLLLRNAKTKAKRR